MRGHTNGPGADWFTAQEPPQFVGQFLRGGVALFRLFLEALQADRFEVARDAVVQNTGCHGFRVPDLEQRFLHGLGQERRSAGEQIVENGAQRVDVAGRPHAPVLAGGQLGGHVIRRPDHLAGEGQVGVLLHPFCQAEIGQMHLVVGEVDEDIRRFEVAVEDALLVGVVNGLGDRPGVAGGLAGGQRFAGQHLGEVLALDKVHREKRLAVHLADLVDGDDAGVMEMRRGLGLALEAFDDFGAGPLAEQEHLEGDDPVELRLPGAKDDAHAAVGNLL